MAAQGALQQDARLVPLGGKGGQPCRPQLSDRPKRPQPTVPMMQEPKSEHPLSLFGNDTTRAFVTAIDFSKKKQVGHISVIDLTSLPTMDMKKQEDLVKVRERKEK
jgi:hypothetical protein